MGAGPHESSRFLVATASAQRAREEIENKIR